MPETSSRRRKISRASWRSASASAIAPAMECRRPRPASASARVPSVTSPAQAKASSNQRFPSTAVPLSQCDHAEPPAISSAVSASSLSIAHSSAARRLSCSGVISLSHGPWSGPVNAALPRPASCAKWAAIAARTRLASSRSLSRWRPYWHSVCSCVKRTMSPMRWATTSDFSTRAWMMSAMSSAVMCRRCTRLRRSRGRTRRGRPRAARRRVARRRTTGRSSSPRRLAASAGAGARCGILP